MKLPDPNLPENKDRVFYRADTWRKEDGQYEIIVNEVVTKQHEGLYFWVMGNVVCDSNNDTFGTTKAEALDILVTSLKEQKAVIVENFRRRLTAYEFVIRDVIAEKIKEIQNGN